MNKKATRWALFMLPAIYSGAINAATNDLSTTHSSTSHSTTNSDEITVISAGRTEQNLWESPVTMQVVDNEKLSKYTSDSIAEALRDIPGVDITDTALAGRKQIRIRGEEASRVLVLIDGQEVTYQRAGPNYSLGLLIDPSYIERIEVVKGPHSVLYGSQAIGGVINFITRKGGDKPLSGKIKAVYDSATAGWQESGLAYGSIGNFDYRLSGSYSDQGNRSTPDGRLPDTHFRNSGQSAWLGYRLGDHKFGLSLDSFKLSTQTYTDSDEYDSFSVRIPELERKKVGLFYDWQLGGKVLKNLHLDAYQQNIKREFRNDLSQSGNPLRYNGMSLYQGKMAMSTGTDDKQTSRGLTLQADITPLADHTLIAGGQWLSDVVKQNAFSDVHADGFLSPVAPFPISVNPSSVSNNHWRQNSWALFAQDAWKITPDWTWTLGARQYWVESLSYGGQKTGTIRMNGMVMPNNSTFATKKENDSTLVTASSLRYSGFDNIQLRASFAQGYVYPTLTHKFYDTAAGGNTTYGNAGLQAETSDNYEVGMRYKDESWLLDSAVYHSRAKDYITTLNCAGNAICSGSTAEGSRYYANANRATTYGMEMYAEYLGWTLSPYVNGNIIRRELELPTRSTYRTGEPTFTGKIGLKNITLFERMELESDLYFRAASRAKDETADTAVQHSGWATANLEFTSTFGNENQYQVTLALNNLLDKRYTTAHESIPASGFSTAIGAAFSF
ncbi:TonB-dependent receptor plug domain-containing protein [Pectobacterium wasabiae]|uniref:Ligand-gated channel n=1 Tax=Pectobacterium wasabiae TaxID=55208 RepID=A0AAW3EH72_9GAMM|nr:TonB-dependent receptor [Pectobacterium wasabiae]AOR61831.1 ligand-gated channel [Pectobacterium wasabiae CFBP 3304]EJS95159.1 Putative outer membrane receptor for iron compound or colicin [Pectobacterium wasabiae CFBP 3304]KFX08114.1 ligand-gated channel [Pectobacterium wasabiae]KGA30749.1 ligand-gated channel [Pectobacterium wasabiae]